jgi:hypothetical protein
MIINTEAQPQDNMKTVKGIGLYKIRYEMDVKDSSREQNYIAGVIAYTSKEAIDTLAAFATKNVKGFKGMKVEEVAFEGLCHAMSDTVKDAILNTAKLEGVVVSKEDYEAVLAEGKKKVKKSIVPKA